MTPAGELFIVEAAFYFVTTSLAALILWGLVKIAKGEM